MDGDLYDEFGNYIGPELSGSEPVSSTGCMAPSRGLAADAGCMHTAHLCMGGPPMRPGPRMHPCSSGAGPQRMRIRAAGRPWSCACCNLVGCSMQGNGK